MNKLDTLKKQWKNQKFAKNFSKEELFHLTQKKSISSIKWIFIFSCIEFFAYLLFPFVIPDYFDAFEYYKSIHLFEFSIVTSILGYFILSFFMIQFINSRKSVNRYIIYNLAVFLGFLVVVLINAFKYDQNYIDLLDPEASGGVSIVKMGLVIIGIMILVLIFLIGFYYLIYGRYFFKLKKNVKELQIIEE